MARKGGRRVLQLAIPMIGLEDKLLSPEAPKRRKRGRKLPPHLALQLEARRPLPEDGRYTADCDCLVEFRRGVMAVIAACPGYGDHDGQKGLAFSDPEMFPTDEVPPGARWAETIGKPKALNRAREGSSHTLKCGCLIRIVRPLKAPPLPLRCERLMPCRGGRHCDWERRKKGGVLTTTSKLVRALLPARIPGYYPRLGEIALLECQCHIKWVRAFDLARGTEVTIAILLTPGEHNYRICEYAMALAQSGKAFLVAETDLPNTGS